MFLISTNVSPTDVTEVKLDKRYLDTIRSFCIQRILQRPCGPGGEFTGLGFIGLFSLGGDASAKPSILIPLPLSSKKCSPRLPEQTGRQKWMVFVSFMVSSGSLPLSIIAEARRPGFPFISFRVPSTASLWPCWCPCKH